MVRIIRQIAREDKQRSYKIIIDGKLYGCIKPGEIKDIDIALGEHTIYLKINWVRSNIINFTVSKNESVEFCCGNTTKGWRSWLVILYAIFF